MLRNQSPCFSEVQYTHSEHGTEVAEISEQLLHRGLLGINSKVFQHVLIKCLHVAVHDHQLAILLPCNLAEAVRIVVKVNNASITQCLLDVTPNASILHFYFTEIQFRGKAEGVHGCCRKDLKLENKLSVVNCDVAIRSFDTASQATATVCSLI